MKNFLVFIALCFAVLHLSPKKKLRPRDPLPEPIQKELEIPVRLAAPAHSGIIGTHTYELTAMIVSRSRYYFDAPSKYSPVDFALAWGPLTSKENLQSISYSQWGRWYRTRYPSNIAIDERDIARNSANTHIIPDYSNKYLAKKILDFPEGSTVHLKGYLVDVSGDDGFEWHSSLTREDTGDGACEVFYVTQAEIIK